MKTRAQKAVETRRTNQELSRYPSFPVEVDTEEWSAEGELVVRPNDLVLRLAGESAILRRTGNAWAGPYCRGTTPVGELHLEYWRSCTREGLFGTFSRGDEVLEFCIEDLDHQFPLELIPECLRIGLPEGQRIEI